MTKRPKIGLDAVHLFGHESRSFAIRAPEGVSADDLRSPETWASVVGKFRKLDEVRVTDYGERWVCWGIVEGVTPGRLSQAAKTGRAGARQPPVVLRSRLQDRVARRRLWRGSSV